MRNALIFFLFNFTLTPFFSQTINAIGGPTVSYYSGERNPLTGFSAGLSADFNIGHRHLFFLTPSARYATLHVSTGKHWAQLPSPNGGPPLEIYYSVIKPEYARVYTFSALANVRFLKTKQSFFYFGLGPRFDATGGSFYRNAGFSAALGFKYHYKWFYAGLNYDWNPSVFKLGTQDLNSWTSLNVSLGYKLNSKKDDLPDSIPLIKHRTKSTYKRLSAYLNFSGTIVKTEPDYAPWMDELDDVFEPGFSYSAGLSLEIGKKKDEPIKKSIGLAYNRMEVRSGMSDQYSSFTFNHIGHSLEMPLALTFYLPGKALYLTAGASLLYRFSFIKKTTHIYTDGEYSFAYSESDIVPTSNQGPIPFLNLGLGYDFKLNEKQALFLQAQFQYRIVSRKGESYTGESYFHSFNESPVKIINLGLSCGFRF